MTAADRAAGRGGPVLAAGAAIAWSNAVLPRLVRGYRWGPGARAAATTTFCLAGAALARTDVPTVPAAVVGAALAVGGVSATLPVRRDAPPPLARWVLVDIPLGTALGEELLFRGALTPALQRSFGAPAGALVGPAVFALWHVGAARASGHPVIPTMTVTFVTGWVFDLIGRYTGRWWPSFVAHWAINGCGAILSSGSVFSSLRVRTRTLMHKA
ncbi:hypothetical protein GCM10027289_04680 [Tsukamurella serpentis]